MLSTGVRLAGIVWELLVLAAGDAAKPATQEALDWGTCLDVGAVTRVLSYRKKGSVFEDRAHV